MIFGILNFNEVSVMSINIQRCLYKKCQVICFGLRRAALLCLGALTGLAHAQTEVKATPPPSEAIIYKPVTPPSYLSVLEQSNPFDPQRKLWPDKVPAPPAPPLPPPPPPVTDQDLQLYGVVIVGQTKKATVKLGKRFSQLLADGRDFVTVSEGQNLGEYTLAEIQASSIVLSAPGVRETIHFNKKTDRVANASVQTKLAPPVTNTESPSNAQVATSANATDNTGTVLAATPASQPPPAAAEVSTDNSNLRNTPAGSLAAAIQSARAAAQNAPQPTQPAQSVTPPAHLNPFMHLLQK